MIAYYPVIRASYAAADAVQQRLARALIEHKRGGGGRAGAGHAGALQAVPAHASARAAGGSLARNAAATPSVAGVASMATAQSPFATHAFALNPAAPSAPLTAPSAPTGYDTPANSASAPQPTLISSAQVAPPPMALLAYELDPVYTLGRRQHLAAAERAQLAFADAQVVHTQRGGHTTFHGPGQLVMYPVLDLRRLRVTVRAYVDALEKSIVDTLGAFGVAAEQRAGAGLNGVWLPGRAAKIAAVGVHCRFNVTTFGLALNVCPDRRYFDRIVACNLPHARAAAMVDVLPRAPPLPAVAARLAAALCARLGAAREAKLESDSYALIEACARR